MAFRVCVVLALLSLFYSVECQTPKVKLVIGTMSACGPTARFIRDQLVPTFNQYEQFLDIAFVPWGRSRVENGNIICHFGENDCWANRMQRCSLNLLNGDQRKQVEFMACDFTAPLPGFGSGSYECAIAAGLNVVDVDHCVNNPQNDNLDEEARIASIEPMAVINAIPYIIVNDEVNRDLSFDAITRLSSLVCFILAADPDSGISGCQI